MSQDEIIAELRFQFGSRLRELRRANGLTQEELSRMSGIDRSRISHLESGDRTTTFDTIMLIAAALGVSLAELFAGIDVSGSRPDESPVMLTFPGGEEVAFRHVRL